MLSAGIFLHVSYTHKAQGSVFPGHSSSQFVWECPCGGTCEMQNNGAPRKKWKILSASDARVRHRCLSMAASASHFIVTGVTYFWILEMFQYISFQILPFNPQVQKSLQTWGHLQRGCQHPLSCAVGEVLTEIGIQNSAQHPAVCPCCGCDGVRVVPTIWRRRSWDWNYFPSACRVSLCPE